MTTQDIATMIAGIGLPYAYDHFTDEDKPAGPPFICFFYPNSADLMADNMNYQGITALVIELYVDNKDFTKEAAVEAALTAAGLPWAKSETWIDSEQMYQVTYETEALLTAAQDNTEVLTTDG